MQLPNSVCLRSLQTENTENTMDTQKVHVELHRHIELTKHTEHRTQRIQWTHGSQNNSKDTQNSPKNTENI